jgi:hypothetical protein
LTLINRSPKETSIKTISKRSNYQYSASLSLSPLDLLFSELTYAIDTLYGVKNETTSHSRFTFSQELMVPEGGEGKLSTL